MKTRSGRRAGRHKPARSPSVLDRARSAGL